MASLEMDIMGGRSFRRFYISSALPNTIYRFKGIHTSKIKDRTYIQADFMILMDKPKKA